MRTMKFKDSSFSKKFSNIKKIIFIASPGDLLKLIVFIACFIVVTVQLRECWCKVNNPPIITHTKLKMNESISYPALTICREPPYNKRYYEQFNFSGLHLESYPITSNWNDFPYDIFNISEFWNVAVYNRSVITCHSLDGLPHSRKYKKSCIQSEPNFELEKEIELQSSLHYTTGMCHTIRPKTSVTAVGKKPGYNILLLHDLYNYDPFRDKEAGWDIYIHEAKEKFTENINIYSGRQGHIFVPVGEKVEVNLDAYQFNSVQNCSNDAVYSLADCEEDCWINNDISWKVNCSGPWMSKLKKPYCNEANGMIDLIKATLTMSHKNCCQKSCNTIQYKASMVKRTPYPRLRKFTSGAWIYFASKAVIIVEEKYSYDWNVFIADLGGSIGFLLGLSVMGIIGYLERIIGFIVVHIERFNKSKVLKATHYQNWVPSVSQNFQEQK